MTISTRSAARTLGHFSGWSASNLGLQKALYLAHMYHLGTTGRPLIDEKFEAWDYGPVAPSLYRAARGFGASPVQDIFLDAPYAAEGSSELRSLQDAARLLASHTPARLVAITHWEKGAWASCYRPGVQHVSIPDEAILGEFRKRFQRVSEAAA